MMHVDQLDAGWAAQPFPSFSNRRRWADPLLRRFWTHGFQVPKFGYTCPALAAPQFLVSKTGHACCITDEGICCHLDSMVCVQCVRPGVNTIHKSLIHDVRGVKHDGCLHVTTRTEELSQS
jgi:hypothetical protein